MTNKANYTVSGGKTRSAELFDAKNLGTGGRKLLDLREASPGQAPFVDAVWHNTSHYNGVASFGFEGLAQMLRYSDVNPAQKWGRQTELTRQTLAQAIDPKHLTVTKIH